MTSGATAGPIVLQNRHLGRLSISIPITRAETYAAYAGLTDKIAFQVAMDQFAMGINYQIPARTPQPSGPSGTTMSAV
jgi:hypothetical protein